MKSKSKSPVAVKVVLKEIQAEMEKQGVTKKELAKRLGCAATNVGQILHSNPGLRISTAERLVGALGFDLEIRLVTRETTGESGE